MKPNDKQFAFGRFSDVRILGTKRTTTTGRSKLNSTQRVVMDAGVNTSSVSP